MVRYTGPIPKREQKDGQKGPSVSPSLMPQWLMKGSGKGSARWDPRPGRGASSGHRTGVKRAGMPRCTSPCLQALSEADSAGLGLGSRYGVQGTGYRVQGRYQHGFAVRIRVIQSRTSARMRPTKGCTCCMISTSLYHGNRMSATVVMN